MLHILICCERENANIQYRQIMTLSCYYKECKLNQFWACVEEMKLKEIPIACMVIYKDSWKCVSVVSWKWLSWFQESWTQKVVDFYMNVKLNTLWGLNIYMHGKHLYYTNTHPSWFRLIVNRNDCNIGNEAKTQRKLLPLDTRRHNSKLRYLIVPMRLYSNWLVCNALSMTKTMSPA